MPDSEEEIYSIMFSSLKHPARRKILRMLAKKPMTFSQMLEALGVSSSHLTYHLENLGELVSRQETGEYRLSTFGAASVETMKVVEEAPAVRSKHGFPLSLKWRSLLAILVIAVVLFGSMSYVQYASLNQLSGEHELLESRYAQLLSWSASADNAITFIQDVIQIDIAAYHATLLSDTVEQRADLGGVVEEILRYSLTDSESKIDVVLRFRNQMLSWYRIYLLEGSPIYAEPQPQTILGIAGNLVQRFSSFEDASYLEDMSNVLALVNEGENVEITEGNIKLKVSIDGGDGTVQWLYTENGVDFLPKSLTLTFEDGVLQEISDGWFLLKIGSTEVNIDMDEAIEIARNAAEGFSWTADGEAVSDFVVLDEPASALFHPTQREEYLTLIPYWEITFNLDKVYPGGVNRIGVGVWADNGEVRRIRTLSG